MFECLKENCDIKNFIESYKKEIIDDKITKEDIENRTQNLLFMSDKITNELYNKFGVEYLYNQLFKDSNKIDFENLDEEEYENIWWQVLDIVEDYINMKVGV